MAPASTHNLDIRNITAGPNAVVFAGAFHGSSFDHVDIAKRRAKVLDYLRLTDPADDRAEIQSQKGRRVPGTCQWIQDHPDYRNWFQGDCAQLWISGGPGTGKTMLSIFITESLEKNNERVIYFFCRHDDEKRNTETSVLRGLLVQLLRSVSEQSFDQHMWPRFQSDKAASYTLSKAQTMWDVFQVLVTSQDSGPTFCVLDGLDECDQDSSRQLVGRFHDLCAMNESTHSTAKFRLAVTSRDPSGFRGFSKIQLEECDLHIRHDIELFIASHIQDALSHKTDFDDWILRWISYELWYRSEGSFLWIGFVARDLLRYRTSSEVKKALERTPKGLGEQYRRILSHIFKDHDDDWKHIQALLAWVALAFVPLTKPQLARAVLGSVSRQHQEHIGDLLNYCEHLLVFNKKTGVFRLVHSSAKEFLVQPHHASPSGSVTDRTHVDDGHRDIMRMCMKILEQTAESDVLRPYAIQFLPQHMRGCKAADISRELPRPFFTVENILQSQWEAWRLSQYSPNEYPEPTPSALHIATYWGILPWVQHQLQARPVWDILLRRNHLESKDSTGMTPLAIAVSNGDVPMVKWLLEQGAIVQLEVAIPEDAETNDMIDPHIRSKSPLVLAFSYGRFVDTLEDWIRFRLEEIASLLLSHLDKPTWRSIRQSRALVQAMDSRNGVAAQWLLDWMPPPPQTSRTHFTCLALVQAIRMNRVEICKQLLDCGADIYSSWESGRNALADAIASNGNERMLDLVFDEYDKRISTSGVGNRRDILLQPLTRLAYFIPYMLPHRFHYFMDRSTFIKEHWSNIQKGFGTFSDSGYSGRVELIGAVLSGSVELVLILLRYGANVNTVDKHGNSILILAMHFGIWEMAKVLLGHGAEVNLVGRAEVTPLTEAVREKRMGPPESHYTEKETDDFLSTFRKEKLQTVSKLLRSGASTMRRTSAGETALSLAANLADADTVSILVKVEPGSQSKTKYWTVDSGDGSSSSKY